jgi:hypothetical protein
VIKQFNFYDIYGYLIPGVLLLGLFWVPVGVLTQSWPDQDLSKSLFLAAVAYILGHLLYSISATVVPSKAIDPKGHSRILSEVMLDKSDPTFGQAFKMKLAGQVSAMFGLDLCIEADGDGEGDLSRNRNTAFMQARAYLISKKAAAYAEQFEGLYAMMRGLGCSFMAGAFYIAGGAVAFYRGNTGLLLAMRILTAVTIFGALACAWLIRSQSPNARKQDAKKSNWKRVDFRLTVCLLFVLFSSGFWISAEQSAASLSRTPMHAESILLASACLALTAAAMCLSAYRDFTVHFAQTVWRDFSACLSFGPTSSQAAEDDSSED